jgi:hypothetical protein
MPFPHDATTASGPQVTLATDLERQRLAQREAQLAQVLAALRVRARSYRRLSTVPQPLSRALADFEYELTTVRARLSDDGEQVAGRRVADGRVAGARARAAEGAEP